MSADESIDQPLSLLAMLAARYPHWTIWFGQATRHWWALPPHDRDIGRFIEAPNVKELVESIEAIQATRAQRRRITPSPQPGGILVGEAEASRASRVPAAAWPGPFTRPVTPAATSRGRPGAAASGERFSVAPPPPPTPP